MNQKQNIAGILLSGGNNSRMGVDKGLLELKGKKFAERQYEKLAQVCNQVLVISNNDSYSDFSFRSIKDFVPGKGPLGGIITGMKSQNADYYFVLAVDLPLVSVKFLEHMISVLHSGSSALVPVFNDMAEPLCAIYSIQCLPEMENSLLANDLKMQNIVKKINPQYLNLGQDSNLFNNMQLFNVNLPSDFQQLNQFEEDES